ncbi:MAG: hypothetical protein K0S67_1674, partial [Nitrososphaeraceae archaeon]|nr:hypothetical protein [Nitrososphaeraceae archaeon]
MINIKSKSTSSADDEYYNDKDSSDSLSHGTNDDDDGSIEQGSSSSRRHRHHDHLSSRERIRQHLGARRIEFISTAVICVIFAVSFAHLEYYYIKDPALQISN